MINNIDKNPDVEVLFLFEGKRATPYLSGYRPSHMVYEGYLTSGMHKYYGVTKVEPGGWALGTISFITPEYYPYCLWVGKEIPIQEGARIKGRAIVLRIYNDVLRAKLKSPHSLAVSLWGNKNPEEIMGKKESLPADRGSKCRIHSGMKTHESIKHRVIKKLQLLYGSESLWEFCGNFFLDHVFWDEIYDGTAIPFTKAEDGSTVCFLREVLRIREQCLIWASRQLPAVDLNDPFSELFEGKPI